MIGLNRREFLCSSAVAMGTTRAIAAPFESAALHADIDLLQQIYETLHPGLYRYLSPAEFKSHCANLKTALTRPSALGRQYLVLSKLLASIRCGHTYANFFNQTKAVAAAIIAPQNKLPFHFCWIGSHMMVTANPLSIEGLSRGDEIVGVNGVPAGQIQAQLLPYMRADGSNDAKRRALLDVNGNDRIESFDVFYPLVFPAHKDQFRLAVRHAKTGAVRTILANAIDQSTREAMAPQKNSNLTPEYWQLTWPKSGIAVLTMPGWAVYNVKWDWRARLTEILDEIVQKDARGLIIDLRKNEGGNDCGNDIIARLITSDLPLNNNGDRLVRFRSTPAALNPYLDTWDRSFEHLGEGAKDLGNGFYRLENGDDSDRHISPTGARFKGKVIVLSGPQNSSATFQFIDLMQRSKLARIYGQPTGGNQRGINGGSFFFVRLPNSGLEVDLPLVGFFPREEKPDAGLTPDVWIEPALGDIATGNDRVLQRALLDLS